jgi:hypothetical protein
MCKVLKSSRTRHKIATSKLYRISHSCVELSNSISIGERHMCLLSFDGLKIKTSCKYVVNVNRMYIDGQEQYVLFTDVLKYILK